jgi:hypothetical protein
MTSPKTTIINPSRSRALRTGNAVDHVDVGVLRILSRGHDLARFQWNSRTARGSAEGLHLDLSGRAADVIRLPFSRTSTGPVPIVATAD